jgi:hypothetical protein
MDKESKVEFRPYIDCDGNTFDPPMSLHFACSVPEDSGQYLSTNFPAIHFACSVNFIYRKTQPNDQACINSMFFLSPRPSIRCSSQSTYTQSPAALYFLSIKFFFPSCSIFL